MLVREAGYHYELESVDGGVQQLFFIKKEQQEDKSQPMVTVSNGTTNEDVLKVLIDRLNFLQAKQPSDHNVVAIKNLEEALAALENRTADRIARGVEGTQQQ